MTERAKRSAKPANLTRNIADLTTLRHSIQRTALEKGVPAADIEAHRAIANAILAGDAGRAVSTSQDLLNEAAMLIKRARSAAG